MATEEYTATPDEIPDGFKRCTHCKEIKVFEEFDRNSRSKDGRRQPCRACRKLFREQNSEILSEKQSVYYAAHSEKYIIWRREYRLNNIEMIREEESKRFEKNPEKFSKQNKRRHRRLRELPNTLTDAGRKFAMDYWENACAVCGCNDVKICAIRFDHWIPLYDALCPGTTPENMIPLCNTKKGTPAYKAGCNQSKNAKNPEKWLIEIFGAEYAQKKLAEIKEFFNAAKLFHESEL